jgi:hypothetical protein
VTQANNRLDPVNQLYVARRNPLACAIGAVAGAVPLGTFHLGHSEISSWDPREDPKCVVAYAGLAFSLLTVVEWAASCFGTERRLETAIKAIGFTTLVEALMMTSTAIWLSVGCLVLLIAINAVANGCRIAMRSAAAAGVSTPRATTMASPRPLAYMPVAYRLRGSPRPMVVREADVLRGMRGSS